MIVSIRQIERGPQISVHGAIDYRLKHAIFSIVKSVSITQASFLRLGKLVRDNRTQQAQPRVNTARRDPGVLVSFYAVPQRKPKPDRECL